MPNGTHQCSDSAQEILDLRMSLFTISKNVADGNIVAAGPSQDEPCHAPGLGALKVQQQLVLPFTSNDSCDETPEETRIGRFEVRPLVQAFKDRNPVLRGIHGGEFRWLTLANVVVASGTISGITNAGTHRHPLPDIKEGCEQPCHAPGFMDGRFCGKLEWWPDPNLIGSQVFGVYRLFVARAEVVDAQRPVTGTIEGLIVAKCQ